MEQMISEIAWLIYVLFGYALVFVLSLFMAAVAYVFGRIERPGIELPRDHRKYPITVVTAGLVVVGVMYFIGRLLDIMDTPGPDVVACLLALLAAAAVPYWVGRTSVVDSFTYPLEQMFQKAIERDRWK